MTTRRPPAVQKDRRLRPIPRISLAGEQDGLPILQGSFAPVRKETIVPPGPQITVETAQGLVLPRDDNPPPLFEALFNQRRDRLGHGGMVDMVKPPLPRIRRHGGLSPRNGPQSDDRGS